MLRYQRKITITIINPHAIRNILQERLVMPRYEASRISPSSEWQIPDVHNSKWDISNFNN